MDKKRKIPNQSSKKVYIRGLVVIGLICILAFSLHLKGNSGGTKDMLQNPVPFYRVENLPFSWAVRSLADEANVPICLETICIPRISRRKPELRINLEIRNTTPKEILDALVAKDRRYFWYEDNGIINFLPREVKEDKTYPLNRKLAKFKVDAKPLRKVITIFTKQARDQAALAPVQFSFADWGSVLGKSNYLCIKKFYKTPVTLDLRDVTLRDILNEIAIQIGDCYWTYTGAENYPTFKFVPFLEKWRGHRTMSEEKTTEQARLHPKISFPEREYNFGEISEGDRITHTFKFKNIGVDPLEINYIEPLEPWMGSIFRIAGETFAPLDEGTIKVDLPSKGRKGAQLITIGVYSNDPDNPVTKLIMKGTVLAK